MLQLVVKVVETSPAYSRIANSALAIVKKVNNSYSNRVPDAAGKKLLQNCLT